MTIARRKQVCLSVTPYYHCVTRCVRQAYLCGFNEDKKRNYNHRRQWIEDRLLLLTQVYCIDVAGFAVMSNHYHVILRVDKNKADKLSEDEVVGRWLKIYRGSVLIQRYAAGEELGETELLEVSKTISEYRDHLSNLSRFMGNLNENIARKANLEDGCTGAFWESRFRSQALLDEEAVLRTMCYVDLNPVRAKMAKTPESSKHTSVHRRLKERVSGLLPFRDSLKASSNSSDLSEVSLSTTFKQYLELLDWTGKLIQKGKRGSVNEKEPSIISRLGYTPNAWLNVQTPTISWRQKALGSKDRIEEYCHAVGKNWIWQF